MQEAYKSYACLIYMAYPIRDVHTFEEFNSIADLKSSLKKNQWKCIKPKKDVKIKGRQTLRIGSKNGIFARLNFSNLLKGEKLVQIKKEQQEFETFKVENKQGNNESSCFISIYVSKGKYTIQSIIFTKDIGGKSEKTLFITTVLDMENRIKEMGRNRKPVVRRKKQKKSRDTEEYWDDDDDDYDDDWYAGEGYGGRTPNDDRSDSMNPNSDRYNP